MTYEDALEAIADAVEKCRADNERYGGETAGFELALLLGRIESTYRTATGREIGLRGGPGHG